MVRGSKPHERRQVMATIGTFKKTGDHEFTGEIVTLGVQARGVRIVPDPAPRARTPQATGCKSAGRR